MKTTTNGEKRIRVAIYGGAYDPVTLDHMRLAAQIIRSDDVDEVWLTPCGPRPDKKLKTATHDRWAMCHVAVNSFFPPELPIKVCAVDVHRENAMFTYDLLRKLSQDYRGTHEFSFVIGSDWLQPGTDIRTWESQDGITGHKLVEEFDFIVLRRPGYDIQGELTQFGPRFKWLNVDSGYELIEGNGSSTAVRNRLKTTKDVYSVAGLVPSGVLGYIRRENLYVNDDDDSDLL
mmetsp:Transcript_17477/g.22774  ORF Transcript_17477/g.22774 Transcript_17477/m.22774 type:complete len:232 (-) Transcript_17477:462-1157(-)|eukprot:CAMPEP_0197293906 /NCGR_PEP_ID=MMETSP0890-20130614/30358_1 /TAXON_ID=44058 ORGANISM="Aureoumbra lagunensis, Strain CCMP1510" /NCGR_SAMPLE_ID=MMETSP0890 /ASSEMBLY_ACC=CAM_ASM_000533 /LENGTH=231 /DNA_ID=CAMNT_0042768989 /DNA_START=269 /DNA_END=964 /DNA_ORIENTATION=+